jgi:hypothetical protein
MITVLGCDFDGLDRHPIPAKTAKPPETMTREETAK